MTRDAGARRLVPAKSQSSPEDAMLGVVIVALWVCKFYQSYTTGEIVIRMRD